jgi:hypothetical protein
MDYIQSFIGNCQRRWRGLTERMLLVGIDVATNDSITCQVLSPSNNNVYNVKIVSYPLMDKVITYCDCPDSFHRGIHCKHIYWLAIKRIGTVNPFHWTPRAIEHFVASHIGQISQRGKNDTCPICLEYIDYEYDFTVCCGQSCGNSVHAICWKRYYFASFSDQCVLCRENTMPSLYLPSY